MHDFEDAEVAIEGRVEHEAHMSPKFNDDYRKLMRGRVSLSQQPKRSLKILDGSAPKLSVISNEMIQKSRTLAGGAFVQESAHVANEFVKKERLPREALLELLFNAFERYAHWTLKGLLEYTNQPAMFLKELLSEIAVYNKKGTHRSTFELRPEYRRHQGPDSKTGTTLGVGTLGASTSSSSSLPKPSIKREPKDAMDLNNR